MAHIAALKMVLLNAPVTQSPCSLPVFQSPRCSTDHLLRHERCCFQQGLYLSEVQLTQTHSGITVICGVGIWIHFGCIFFGWYSSVRSQECDSRGTSEHMYTYVTSRYSCSLSCWLAATCSTWQKALHATACSPLGHSFPGSCTQIAIAPAAVGDDPDYRPAEWLEGIHFGRRKSRTKRQ